MNFDSNDTVALKRSSLFLKVETWKICSLEYVCVFIVNLL